MLYFSKLKIISVLIFTIVISFFAITNFIKVEVAISENVKVEVIKSTGIQSLVSNTETKK